MNGISHFGVYSWLAIGQAIGIIPPEATVAERMVLKPEQHQKLAKLLIELKQRMVSL